MRCRARIDKEDFPVRYSIRFRNPFRIPTAFYSFFPPFFSVVLLQSVGKGDPGQDTGHQSFLSSLRSGLQIPPRNSTLDSSSCVQYKRRSRIRRVLCSVFLSWTPFLPSWNPQHSNIPLRGKGMKKEGSNPSKTGQRNEEEEGTNRATKRKEEGRREKAKGNEQVKVNGKMKI